MKESEARRKLPQGWQRVRLGEVCKQNREIINPDSHEAEELPYLSLEHIECGSGRVLRQPSEANGDEGKSTTFAFDSRHVLYGKLRPYLNKVALPDFQGRCTTELIPLLPKEGVDRQFLAWLLRRKETIEAAMQGRTGSRMPRADMGDLLRLEIPLPPLSEQQRLAILLHDQMVAVERARAAAEAQLEAAKALPAAYLRAVFKSPEAQAWPWHELSEMCDFLPAKSVAQNGDLEVEVITTACLTESGFQPSGIRKARMWQADFEKCVVAPGEVLIARSNTIDLVGRVALYPGQPAGVAATDLTIRIWAKEPLNPSFLSAYLSFLYLSGYWKNHAGGASGSMKKIRREQILKLKVPVPSASEQDGVIRTISEKMAIFNKTQEYLTEQLHQIDKLPAALLRRAFNGEL